MSEPLGAKYMKAVAATLGFEGRMISYSKSGYHERHPLHLAVFNANVCVPGGKLWHGDLDLTLDEPKLAELAAEIDEIVHVLYEYDGRFEHEQQPLLDKAVYSVTPTGHNRFQHRFIERSEDGTLRRRPRDPDTRSRWVWSVLRHRPRLLHSWRIDRRNKDERTSSGRERSTLTYVGARDGSLTPLLVIGCSRANRLHAFGFELIWYPAHEPPRNAPRPLISLRPAARVGRLRLWLTIIVWPGYKYEFRAGYAVKQRCR